MSNIYLKVTIETGELQLTKLSLKLKTSYYNLNIRGLGAKLRVPFYYFNFERNDDVLKPKILCILFSKNLNFNKNETESIIESHKHSFKETNLALQLIQESQIKSITVMNWSSLKKKGYIVCTVHFAQRKSF